MAMEGSDLSEIEKLLEEDIDMKESGESDLNKEVEVNQAISFENTDCSEMEQLLEEDTKIIAIEGLEKEESAHESINTLQSELYKTMLLQIQLAKGKMDADQYESFIKGYLHPDLGDQEYGSFAFCLIQHYIDEGKVNDLNRASKGHQSRITDTSITLACTARLVSQPSFATRFSKSVTSISGQETSLIISSIDAGSLKAEPVMGQTT